MLPSSLCHKLAEKTEHTEIKAFFHNRKAAPKEEETFGLLIHNENEEKQQALSSGYTIKWFQNYLYKDYARLFFAGPGEKA